MGSFSDDVEPSPNDHKNEFAFKDLLANDTVIPFCVYSNDANG